MPWLYEIDGSPLFLFRVEIKGYVLKLSLIACRGSDKAHRMTS